MGMSERYDRLAREREEIAARVANFKATQEKFRREREEIAARVANFKATQEKFRREREEYFTTTLENARQGERSKRTLERVLAWP
jgi:chorismate mutase